MSLKCRDIVDIMNKIAPENLQEKWDNSGLNIGNKDSEIKKIMVALDIIDDVIDEAIENNVDIIVTHHPILLFKDLKNITTDTDIGLKIYKLIQNNISVYSAHTSYDIVFGGTNDILAEILGLSDIEILKETNFEKTFKIVVYVPYNNKDDVVSAIGEAFGGCIGNYSNCMFLSKGEGQFKPLEGSNPYIGSVGDIEKVKEYKIETIVTENNISNVLNAIYKTHCYEEPAIDIIPMNVKGKRYGIGRIGNLKNNMNFIDFAKFVKKKLNIDNIRISVDDENTVINKVAICTGAGSDFFDIAKSKGADVYITGDIKFHEAQKAKQLGLCVIDGTHYATENIAIPVLAEYLKKELNNINEEIEILVSKVNGQTFKNI